MKSRTTEQLERDGKRIEEITELVPYELCAELVKKFLDDNAMIVDHEFCVELWAELVKKFLDDNAMIVGEEIIDADVIEEMIDREAKTLRTELVRDWINILSNTYRRITGRVGAPNWIGLDLRFLPWARPDIFFERKSYGQYKTWYEVLERQNFLNAVAIRKEDVQPLFETFVENVSRETQENERFVLPDGLFISKGPGFYYLSSE